MLYFKKIKELRNVHVKMNFLHLGPFTKFKYTFKTSMINLKRKTKIFKSVIIKGNEKTTNTFA